MQAEAGAPLSRSAQVRPAPSPPRPQRRLLWLVLAVAALWVILDQVTKAWAERALPDRPPVEVVGDLLQLRLTYNSGAAFSMATGATGLLTVLACTVVVVIIWQASRLGSRAWAWALGLLLGGATGNLIDRVFRPPSVGQGHVVDFFQLPNFPIFNVADIGISSAAVLIAGLALHGIGPDGSRSGHTRPDE